MHLLLFQVFGQIVDDKSHIFKVLREQNETGSRALGFSRGNVLLHIAPALRYLPRFPPFVQLMDAVKKRERLWNHMLGPALVRALSNTAILCTKITRSLTRF